MAFGKKKQSAMGRRVRRFGASTRKGFDIAAWLVPTLSFMIFVYAMVFVVFYTVRVGGPNVSLYVVDETQKPFKPQADVEQVLQGISDAFDPNKK